MKHLNMLIAGLMCLTGLLAGSNSVAAVFGADSREEVTPTSEWNSLARSTAVAALYTELEKNKDGTSRLLASREGDLCTDEKFAGQPSISYSCTAFLVAPDLLATAGHCLLAINTPHQEIQHERQKICKIYDWVFDYQMKDDGSVNLNTIPRENIYHCSEVIYAVQHDHAPFTDFALIRLDRPVKGRQPLKIASGPLTETSGLSVIGHPFGSPTKVATDGKVLLNDSARSSFVTNLDVFEGNSGSPVFNSKKEVIGILVAGTPSWNTFTNPNGKCELLNRCDEDGTHCLHPDEDTSVFPEYQTTGSEVQRIDPIRALISKSKRH